MSNSETAVESFPLKVQSEPDVRITIYDGWGEIVGEENGYLERDLPRGFYEVRTELAGEIEEELIRHDRRRVEPHWAKSPSRYTSAPLVGAVTSHEYYIVPAAEWSRRDTCEVPIGGKGPATSRLFLFVRAVSREQVTGQDLTAQLRMIDPSGEVLWEPSADREHTRRNDDDGWIAFTADVACRTIFLEYTGEPARTVPIHFYPNWDTQLFLLHHGRPRFETLRFFMAGKGEGFQPDDEVARNVDLALTGLQNRTNLLPRWVMDDLLKGKFRNPIEGLIGAHFLLRELEPDAERIDLVLRNLASLLPNSPDVRALEILGAQRLSRPINPEPLGEPPMLRAGLEAVIAASAEVRGLIPRGSGLDRISSRTFADTPWSSWQPLGEPWSSRETGSISDISFSEIGAPTGSIIGAWFGSIIGAWFEYLTRLGFGSFNQYLTRSGFGSINPEASKIASAGQEEAWVVRSALGWIIDTLRQGGVPSLPDIARELRLTPDAVVRALAGVAQDLKSLGEITRQLGGSESQVRKHVERLLRESMSSASFASDHVRFENARVV